jgi:hypothetical protein
MLKAMIAGEAHAHKLAAMGSERLGCAPETLVEALTGRMREHHRFLLAQHLKTIEQLEKTIAAFDARIEEKLVRHRRTPERGAWAWQHCDRSRDRRFLYRRARAYSAGNSA